MATIGRYVACGRCGQVAKDAEGVTFYDGDRVTEICHERCLTAAEAARLEPAHDHPFGWDACTICFP